MSLKTTLIRGIRTERENAATGIANLRAERSRLQARKAAIQVDVDAINTSLQTINDEINVLQAIQEGLDAEIASIQARP